MLLTLTTAQHAPRLNRMTSIESELRAIADILAPLSRQGDAEARRTLGWAVIQLHYVAQQIRKVSVAMVGESQPLLTWRGLGEDEGKDVSR